MEELEKERALFLKKHKKRNIIAMIIFSLFYLIATLIVIYYIGKNIGWDWPSKIYLLIWLIIYLIFLPLFYFSKGEDKDFYDNYRKSYRKNIVNKALNEIFTDVHDDYSRGLDESEISEADIIDMGTTYKAEDYYSGKYKGISFEVSDVKTSHAESDGESGTRIVIDFAGQYYIFESNKKIDGKVSITKNFGIKQENNSQYISTEDIDFNKEFLVKSTDEHLAFYVLTPAFMEKLKDIKKAHQLVVNIGFIHDKIHIAIFNKDMFEFDPFHEINVDNEVNKIKEELKVITNIVDILDLDNDLYK